MSMGLCNWVEDDDEKETSYRTSCDAERLRTTGNIKRVLVSIRRKTYKRLTKRVLSATVQCIIKENIPGLSTNAWVERQCKAPKCVERMYVATVMEP